MANGYGRTALVTGASSGIGLELARALADEGYDLILTARRRARLEALAQELYAGFGTQVTVLPADLAKPGTPAALKRQIDDRELPVDVLVNNAGFGQFRDFTDCDKPRLNAMVQVNIGAVMNLTYLFVPDMIARGMGHILNIASVAGFTPTAGATVYGATKAFVLSFSEGLSQELSDSGVSVTASCPGLTETEFSHIATGASKDSGLPPLLKLNAQQVAVEAVKAMHMRETVKVHGIAYQWGLTLSRLQPRFVNRFFGGVFAKQMQDGF